MVPANNSTLGELQDLYKDPDGFLYINVCLENTFG